MSREESFSWVLSRGVDLDFETRELMTELPKVSPKITRIALDLAEWVFRDRQCLLLIGNHAVDAANSIPLLFDVYRGTPIVPGSATDTPGTLVSAGESMLLGGLVALSLYFRWDVVLLDEPAEILFTASHEGRFTAEALRDPSKTLVETFKSKWLK